MLETIITIAGIAASVVTYYLGRRAGRRDREEARRLSRIEGVVSKYVEIASPGRDSGPHALIESGIRGLKDDGEYREAFLIITDRLGRHPLGSRADQLKQADMGKVFEALQMDRITIPNYEHVMERFRDH